MTQRGQTGGAEFLLDAALGLGPDAHGSADNLVADDAGVVGLAPAGAKSVQVCDALQVSKGDARPT